MADVEELECDTCGGTGETAEGWCWRCEGHGYHLLLWDDPEPEDDRDG